MTIAVNLYYEMFLPFIKSQLISSGQIFCYLLRGHDKKIVTRSSIKSQFFDKNVKYLYYHTFGNL